MPPTPMITASGPSRPPRRATTSQPARRARAGLTGRRGQGREPIGGVDRDDPGEAELGREPGDGVDVLVGQVRGDLHQQGDGVRPAPEAPPSAATRGPPGRAQRSTDCRSRRPGVFGEDSSPRGSRRAGRAVTAEPHSRPEPGRAGMTLVLPMFTPTTPRPAGQRARAAPSRAATRAVVETHAVHDRPVGRTNGTAAAARSPAAGARDVPPRQNRSRDGRPATPSAFLSKPRRQPERARESRARTPGPRPRGRHGEHAERSNPVEQRDARDTSGSASRDPRGVRPGSMCGRRASKSRRYTLFYLIGGPVRSAGSGAGRCATAREQAQERQDHRDVAVALPESRPDGLVGQVRPRTVRGQGSRPSRTLMSP